MNNKGKTLLIHYPIFNKMLSTNMFVVDQWDILIPYPILIKHFAGIFSLLINEK